MANGEDDWEMQIVLCLLEQGRPVKCLVKLHYISNAGHASLSESTYDEFEYTDDVEKREYKLLLEL